MPVKIKKRSASGNFLLSIKKVTQIYNQCHGLRKEQGKCTYPFTLHADTALLINSILLDAGSKITYTAGEMVYHHGCCDIRPTYLRLTSSLMYGVSLDVSSIAV